MKVKMFSDVQRVCCTSVHDGAGSLRFIHDPGVLQECLYYESSDKGMNRSTMIKAIQARIRQVKRERRVSCPGK